jgi:hypothetical protein
MQDFLRQASAYIRKIKSILMFQTCCGDEVVYNKCLGGTINNNNVVRIMTYNAKQLLQWSDVENVKKSMNSF